VHTILDDIPVTLDAAALSEKLHLEPGSEEAAEFEALLGRVRGVGRPKVLYRMAAVSGRGPDAVAIDGVWFTSPILARNLEGVERVFPYVATCGVEYDAIALPEQSMLCRFWLDAIKEEALMQADEFFNRHVEHAHRPGPMASMNPGASGSDVWTIKDQRPLFALIGDVEARIGVRLTESCLMIPNKSVSGIRFPSAQGFENCAVCPREVCQGRRAPYDHVLALKLRGHAGAAAAH
jgi:hypothetical protein